MIRQAQTRDIPHLTTLFLRLLQSLEDKGNQLYTGDERRFLGGVQAFICDHINVPGRVILVQTDEEDQPTAFIVGRMAYWGEFFEDWQRAEIQFLFPLSWAVHPLRDAFDDWGRQQGATIRTCGAMPGHELSWKAFERDGMSRDFYYYSKRLA